MTAYESAQSELAVQPRTWLVTGAAGFLGCNLVEKLLKIGQQVVGLDNFATGHRHNLDAIKHSVGVAHWTRFRFIEGDISELDACREAVRGVDYVLHQAGLGSVPRSIDDPIRTNRANVDGFLNMLVATREAGAKRFVYAASSSTYGDHPGLPKVEHRIGNPLSPYAVTKYVNELYAAVFAHNYGVQSIGLRYFNIFGPHQDPNGAYAAVIPTWTASMLKGETVNINGDGETSRDFCYVANAVQANLLAATSLHADAANKVYNIAVGQRTSLNELYRLIRSELLRRMPQLQIAEPRYQAFRAGDVRHSIANIDKAKSMLGYTPTHTIADGIGESTEWYLGALGGEVLAR